MLPIHAPGNMLHFKLFISITIILRIDLFISLNCTDETEETFQLFLMDLLHTQKKTKKLKKKDLISSTSPRGYRFCYVQPRVQSMCTPSYNAPPLGASSTSSPGKTNHLALMHETVLRVLT